MDPVLAIAQSGLADATARLGAAAQGIAAGLSAQSASPAATGSAATAPTPQPGQSGLAPATATALQAGGSDDLIQSMVGLIQASVAYKANLRVLQVGEETLDATLNLRA